MPTKSKGQQLGSLKLKATDESVAVRRTRREPKRAYNLFKDEDEAQLELAIKLSLQAQRLDEKKKNKVREPQEKKPKTAKVEKQQPTQKSAISTDQLTSTHAEKPKKHVTSANTRSPTAKKKKMENILDIVTTKGENIPSTASFISYVLQKGSHNRDMSLVKQFEREESHELFNVVANAESESDWENS